MKTKIIALSTALMLAGFAGCSSSKEAKAPAPAPEPVKVEKKAEHKEEAKKEEAKADIKHDPETGLKMVGDWEKVKLQCTPCHSAALVTQNKGDKRQWLEMIRWMQATQKLWDLGDDEPLILEYLSTYYGPTKAYRRPPLKVEWQ